MTEDALHPIFRDIENRYRQKTTKSYEQHVRARNHLPGGDTRTATYYQPYPTIMASGKGYCLYDVDGNQYIDLLNNYSALIHGHAHPRVIEAARSQLEKGSVFGSATEIQYLHAEHLCARVPCLEQVRYGNSGTEATLFAMRAARAFSGREMFIKMDGGYHGSHDFIEVNVFPGSRSEPDKDGLPARHVEPGAPKSVLNDILVVPFNDLDAVEGLLKKYDRQIAAVIVEPMLGALGMVVPRDGYLKTLRELTETYGVLLIFDEVITFRISTGGIQESDGVTPDLTALGKIIGGGFPIGAFGGRKDIMDLFNPSHPKAGFHSGTFNGTDVVMAAGLAALELYDQHTVDRINALGEKLRNGINEAFNHAGLTGQATGRGSLAQIHWRLGEIANAMDSVEGSFLAGDLPRYLHLELMNRGYYCAPRAMLVISTPMDENVIDGFLHAFAETLKVLKPYVEQQAPRLLVSKIRV
jgi:glutamate-1-semialdehyde 2,1-aminomutase